MTSYTIYIMVILFVLVSVLTAKLAIKIVRMKKYITYTYKNENRRNFERIKYIQCEVYNRKRKRI